MEQTNYNGAAQKPIGSGFTTTSTASDVIKGMSLAGKVADTFFTHNQSYVVS